MKKYYREYASTLFKNGYKPIPIRPKSKIPFMEKGESWQVNIDQDQVDEWASNGKGSGGIGLTGLCGIDFDIHDKDTSNNLIKFIRENINQDILIRIGQAPKFLIPASPESAIQKKKKNTWYDQSGIKHELEFLAPGDQYFLAYGIHPDTGKEFNWNKKRDVLKTPADQLPIFDDLDISQIEDELDRLAESKGWTQKKPKNNRAESDSNKSLENYKPPGGTSLIELKSHLEKLPVEYCDEYTEWVKIGSAIHHGTAGSDEGFNLFDVWSRKSAKYKGAKDTKKKWKSFSTQKYGDDCATVGTIVHILQEENLLGTTDDFETRITNAASKSEIRGIMKDIQKDTTIDTLSRCDLAIEIRGKIKQDLKSSWPLPDIKKKLQPKKKKKEIIETEDDWLNGWAFLVNQNKFAKVGSADMITRSAFNGMYNRLLVDRHDLEAKHQEADRYALEIKKIKYVHDVLYYPAAGEYFEFDGQSMLNGFNPNTIGERKPKAEWTEQDGAAVDLFNAHVCEMFDKPGEAGLLLDTMAHIVQNPHKRIMWALVMYGCEGDGKTTICKVLSRAVGTVNAGIVNGSDIVSSVFSDWAVGQVVKTVEELKVPGKNRYDTIEKIKTFITNDVISINPKYQVPKKIPNTASVVVTTNHADAIPYQSDSRRFAVIGSKWLSLQQIHKKHGKDYFTKMIRIFEKHETALNEYLSTYKISKDFSPYILPVTQTLLSGIHNEKNDLIILIEDLIEKHQYPAITKNVIVMKNLRETITKLVEFDDDIELENPPTLGEIKRALKKLKYKQSEGQFNIFGKGQRVWFKDILPTRENIIIDIEKGKTDDIDIF